MGKFDKAVERKVIKLDNYIKEKYVDEVIYQLNPRELRDYPLQETLPKQSEQYYKTLETSIEKVGILQPLICRRKEEGIIEVILGHERRNAAIKADFETVPAMFVVCTDTEADYMWLVSNENKEFDNATKMKRVAMQFQLLEKLKNTGEFSGSIIKEISDSQNISERSAKMHKKINDSLIEPLKDLFYNSTIGIVKAEKIASLDEESQKFLLQLFQEKENNFLVLKNEEIENIKKMKDDAFNVLKRQYMEISDNIKNMTEEKEKLEKEYLESLNLSEEEKNKLENDIKEIKDDIKKSEEFIKLENLLNQNSKNLSDEEEKRKKLEKALDKENQEKRALEVKLKKLEAEKEEKKIRKFKILSANTIGELEKKNKEEIINFLKNLEEITL